MHNKKEKSYNSIDEVAVLLESISLNLCEKKLPKFINYWRAVMINNFHLIFIVLIVLIWKQSIPFIKNDVTQQKVKLISKIAFILVIMFFTLFTQSLDTLIELDGDELIKADLSIFGTSKRLEITGDNEQELEDLNVLLEEVKIKYTLKFPKKWYAGYTVTLYLNTENDFIPFQVTDSNHIWYKGKFYKCINLDLFSYFEEALDKQDINDIPTN